MLQKSLHLCTAQCARNPLYRLCLEQNPYVYVDFETSPENLSAERSSFCTKLCARKVLRRLCLAETLTKYYVSRSHTTYPSNKVVLHTGTHFTLLVRPQCLPSPLHTRRPLRPVCTHHMQFGEPIVRQSFHYVAYDYILDAIVVFCPWLSKSLSTTRTRKLGVPPCNAVLSL